MLVGAVWMLSKFQTNHIHRGIESATNQKQTNPQSHLSAHSRCVRTCIMTLSFLTSEHSRSLSSGTRRIGGTRARSRSAI